MADPVANRPWTGRLTFVLLFSMLVVASILPLDTRPPSWVGPDIMLALTLVWVVRRPDLVPLPIIAVLWFLTDLLLQHPPGLMTALVVLLTEALRSRNATLRSMPFLIEWLSVSAGIIAITLDDGNKGATAAKEAAGDGDAEAAAAAAEATPAAGKDDGRPDELIGVEVTGGRDHVILGTKSGLAIRFEEQDMRPAAFDVRAERPRLRFEIGRRHQIELTDRPQGARDRAGDLGGQCRRAVRGLHVGHPADAPQADAVAGVVIGQAGREVGHVLDGIDPDQVALLGGVGRDRHRHVLEALLPPFGGDHELLDHVGVCALRVRDARRNCSDQRTGRHE